MKNRRWMKILDQKILIIELLKPYKFLSCDFNHKIKKDLMDIREKNK